MVALFAAAELSTTSYYYLRRYRVAAPATRPAVVAAKPTPAPVKPVTRATPPPAAVASPSIPGLSETDRLVQQATALRSQGDTTNALARLIEAANREPKNTKVLVEMAKTYEVMQLADRATETWRKIQALGPSGGASYDLAVARLKPPVVATPAPVTAPTVAPAVAPQPPQTAETTPASSTFTIAQVKATEEPDPETDTNLTLRISVKKQTNAVVDHTKVKIQVFFFDTVDDKDIKLTDADVNYEWVTPKHDWAGPDPEVLAVSYVRPKNKVLSSEAALSAAAASVQPGRRPKPPANPSPAAETGQRRYLGYIVRVYYHDQLQATKAEPKRLLKLPPEMIGLPASP